MNDDNKVTKLMAIIKKLEGFAILESIIMAAIFIINNQLNKAIVILVLSFCFLAFYRSLLKLILRSKHKLFASENVATLYFSLPIIYFMIIIFILFTPDINKRSYTIGEIKIKFPKEIGFIYGNKDESKKYSSVHYYYDYCSIEIEKFYNDTTYSIFDNIKNNANLNTKITNNVRLIDIYTSEFINGKEIINGKEWTTYYTEVDTIRYTIYYMVIDDYIYQMSISNYNENPAMCTNRVNETFKTIEYNS